MASWFETALSRLLTMRAYCCSLRFAQAAFATFSGGAVSIARM